MHQKISEIFLWSQFIILAIEKNRTYTSDETHLLRCVVTHFKCLQDFYCYDFIRINHKVEALDDISVSLIS